jgi:very-short-patch-repair endonuclease
MSFLIYNQDLLKLSQSLRNNMTDAERHLWSKLRLGQIKGCTFYRQKIIGNYIVDFFCSKAKLVIEVDGSQHFEEQGLASDKIRDEYLTKLGYRVLRFNDHDVLNNAEGVVEMIFQIIVVKGKILP